MFYGTAVALVTIWFMAMTLGCAGDAMFNMASFRPSALHSIEQYTIAGCASLNRSTLTQRMNSASTLNRVSTLQRIYRLSNPSLDVKSVASDAWSLPPEMLLSTSASISSAYDNCRFGLLVIALSYVINHIPYMILCLYGAWNFSTWSDGPDFALWMVLLEAVIWPHLLWLANGRYREGYVFIGDVLTCRQPLCIPGSDEEDEVRLQSYTIRQNDFTRDARPQSLHLTTLDDVRRLSRGEPLMLNAMRRYHDNLAQRGVLNLSNSTSVLSGKDSHIDIPRQIRRGSEPYRLQRSRSDVGYGGRSSIRKSFNGSPRKNIQADHVRSPHLNSRLEWKKRMREQFLPPSCAEECERIDACLNPMVGAPRSQNIPEETSEVTDGVSIQLATPSTSQPPASPETGTISSCDTMIVHDGEESSEHLDIAPVATPDCAINSISDTALENAFAVKELNRAALSRGAEAHAVCRNYSAESQGQESNSDGSSNRDIFQDALSDLGVFYTNESGSSVSDDRSREADLVSSPEPEFLSVAATPVGSERTSLCSTELVFSDAHSTVNSTPRQSFSNVFF